MKRTLSAICAALLLVSTACWAQTLTFSTPGLTSFVVPSNVAQINFAVYGSGDNGPIFDSTQSGQGGGFCQAQVAVTPGQTVYVQVSEQNPPGGSIGLNSWFNLLTNVQPANSAQGCFAESNNKNVVDNCGSAPGGVCMGIFGQVNHSGGTFTSGTTVGGGGAGGPGGDGTAGTGSAGGHGGAGASLGTPPVAFPAGGAGGSPGNSGLSPGGGASGSGGGGANGLVIAVYILNPSPPGSSSGMFLTWPG